MPLEYYEDDSDDQDDDFHAYSFKKDDSDSIFRGFLFLREEIIARYNKKKQQEALVFWLTMLAFSCLIWLITYFVGIYVRGMISLFFNQPPFHVVLTTLYLATWISTSKWFVNERKKAEEKYEDLKKRLQKVADKKICQHELRCKCREEYFKELEKAGVIIYH